MLSKIKYLINYVAIIALMVLFNNSSVGSEIVKPHRSLVGKLLVSASKMDDPRFYGTVIIIVHHSTNGALGLVINKPLRDISTAEISEGIGLPKITTDKSIKVHFGGPVEQRQIFVIHSTDYSSASTISLTNDISVSGDKGTIHNILRGKGPRQFLLIMGYAGWSSGQLESELASNDWEISPAESDVVLDKDYETKWQRAMRQRLIDL